MAASKTGLLHYKDVHEKSVYAAKIRAIEDFKQAGAPQGSKVLHFEQPRKQSNLIGEWVAQQSPVVGGYFVVFDNSEGQSVAVHMKAPEFESTYTRVT